MINNGENKVNIALKTLLKIMLTFLLVLSCLLINQSLSKYTSKDSQTISTTVSGFGQIKLNEYNGENSSTLIDSITNTFDITPGLPITKKIEINYHLPESSSVGCCLFLKVKAESWNLNISTNNFSISKNNVSLLNFTVNSNYNFLKTENSNEHIFFINSLEAGDIYKSFIIENNEISTYAKMNKDEVSYLESISTSFNIQTFAIQNNGNLTPLELWELI